MKPVRASIASGMELSITTFSWLAKITCFITDIAYYPGYSKVRSETWPKDPPASSTVVVAGLVRPEFLVEVEAIVRLPS